MVKQTQIDNEITLFTANYSNVNAVLIEYDTFLVCIDTLLLPADSRELASAIISRKKPLQYLINTHGHSDHCLGNRVLAQTGTFLIAHEKYALTNWAESAFLKNIPTKIKASQIMPPNITFSQNLLIPECDLQILHTPGHSPDASVINLPVKKLLITGDTILNSDSDQIAIPYFYWGDLDKMLSSLEMLSSLNTHKILPGHGNPCSSNKIQYDILYLHNFKKRMDDFLEANEYLTVDQLKEMAFIEIGADDCLPGTNKEDFWVPKMHQLNIERYIEWKIEGKSIETLNFPYHNDI